MTVVYNATIIEVFSRVPRELSPGFSCRAWSAKFCFAVACLMFVRDQFADSSSLCASLSTNCRQFCVGLQYGCCL